MMSLYAMFKFTGVKRMTNKARLWYVSVGLNDHSKILTVPPMTYSSPKAEAKGRRAYEEQKASRQMKEGAKDLVSFQIPTKLMGELPY